MKTVKHGITVTFGDVASMKVGPQMRCGIAELNGKREVAGGLIGMRVGGRPRERTAGGKAKLAELRDRMSKGVEIVTIYNRSGI